MTPDQLVESARKYKGTPFRHMGRNKYGLDCIGLIIVSVADAGLGKYDTPPYGRQPSRYLLDEEVAKYLHRVLKRDIQRGDILICRFGRYPQHIALYTGKNLIHSYEHVGGVVEHRMDEKWLKRVFAAYRFKEFMQ